MRYSSPARQPRSGFTLLELMLVLAILVMIGSIASPMIGDLFERQKLRGAIDTLRLQWEEARLKAMRTGQAQVFTCELGTNAYSIKPLVLQSDAVNVGTGATLAVGGGLIETENFGRGTVAVAADLTDSDARELEDKISFLSCLVMSDMRSFSLAQESQTLGTGAINTQTVAQTVIFYPDGSTSTAEVQIQNELGDIRGLQIRGLTGQVRVVEISSVPSAKGAR